MLFLWLMNKLIQIQPVSFNTGLEIWNQSAGRAMLFEFYISAHCTDYIMSFSTSYKHFPFMMTLSFFSFINMDSLPCMERMFKSKI